MPDLYVFSGGRRDRNDARVPVADHLHPSVEEKLLRKMSGPAHARRAKALAIAAVRETFEEVGIFIAAPGETSRQGKLESLCRTKHRPEAFNALATLPGP